MLAVSGQDQSRHDDSMHRIGLLVPSSNTTMETEIPELLQRQQRGSGHRFSVHSARLRLQQVTPESLARMNRDTDGAVELLCDARVDAILYGSLAAVMAVGRHRLDRTSAQLAARAAGAAQAPRVITSAGALVAALECFSAARISMIAPYRKAVSDQIVATLGECGIRVVQSRSLEIVDNVEVGRLDPAKLLSLAAQMDFSGSDALVISACAQMPSLGVIDQAEQKLGLPVVSAATASVFDLLSRLDVEPAIADAGMLLRSRDRADRRAVRS